MTRARRARTLLGLAAASAALIALAACSSGAPAASDSAEGGDELGLALGLHVGGVGALRLVDLVHLRRHATRPPDDRPTDGRHDQMT